MRGVRDFALEKMHASWTNRARNAEHWAESLLHVTRRRLAHGPLLPGWSRELELAVDFLRRRNSFALSLESVEQQREFLDSWYVAADFPSDVTATAAEYGDITGRWFTPVEAYDGATILYFQGGGYAFRVRMHDHLIARFAAETKSRTLALNYRLSPECPFPAQVEDAVAAYGHLLELGFPSENVVLAGDSAGANLVLSTLLTLRDADWPMPALGICLSPWTDLTTSGASATTNARYDWINKAMADQWAAWFCQGRDPTDRLLSPMNAELHNLPPLYVQAGGAEILIDSIRAFAARAKMQGAPVILDVWPNMVHVFQGFGPLAPQNEAAWRKIRAALAAHVSGCSGLEAPPPVAAQAA